MLDTNAHISLDGPARLGPGVKLVIRWPTDPEWFARIRTKKYITRNMGRGRKETVLPDPGESDSKLYAAITQNGSPPISAAEASMILDAIIASPVTDVHVEDGFGFVDMNTVAGAVVHKIKIPTAEQILQWRRGAIRIHELAHSQQEMRFNPETGAALYDSCNGTSTGYAAAIPGPHKDIAIRALIEYVDQNIGPRIDDADF